jgi:hypothetical protein
MKKLYIILICLVVFIAIRFIFCYRIIPFQNSGYLKYKEGEGSIIYFPNFPFINPFKKQDLITKITDYINSEHYRKSHKPFDSQYFTEKALENELVIKSMITDSNDNYLIFVSVKGYPDAESVFTLDQEKDRIVDHQ